MNFSNTQVGVGRVASVMFRRITTLISAAALGGAMVVGLTAGAAHAAPNCSDLHWIGAAGSGERAGDPTANGGMGRVVYQSLQDLKRVTDDSTVTAEAVQYPAAPVPADGDILGWLGFMDSVDAGVAALGQQYASYVQRCPDTDVVLAGYSQGAMVVHRNLHALAGSPNLDAALLIADGDRIPDDTTVSMGSVTEVPGAGRGVAQEWPTLARAPQAKLPPSLGSRTISVCDLGDPVCDHDPDAEAMAPAAVDVHTSYASRDSGYRWTQTLSGMVTSAPENNELALAGS